MQKVYLSSTFRDLEEYRSGLIELFALLNNEFPLNAMEMYTAVDKPTLQNCMDDAAQCDIYILLLANRYGYIPEDAVLNPEKKSITEREFETAVKNEKVVFAFFADTSQKEKFAEDEENEAKAEKQRKLQLFRQEVTRLKQPSSPFRTPKELSDRVASALIKWLNPRVPAGQKIFDEKSRYCCDRFPQFTDYEKYRVRLPSKFHVFISNGIEADLGGNLVNRCAIFSLDLDETDIFIIAFEEFFSEDYEMSRDNFLHQLRKKVSTIDDSLYVPASEVFEEINRKAKEYTIIRISCEEEFLDEYKSAFLARIFEEFYKSCEEPAFKKHVYFFVNIEDCYENRPEGQLAGVNLLKQQTHYPQAHITFLARFAPVDKKTLKIWIQNYITPDEGKRNAIFREHFSGLPDSFRMDLAESQIHHLYKRIAQKDPKIIDIL